MWAPFVKAIFSGCGAFKSKETRLCDRNEDKLTPLNSSCVDEGDAPSLELGVLCACGLPRVSGLGDPRWRPLRPGGGGGGGVNTPSQGVD